MSNKPMFFFAAVYDDPADAEHDYAAVKALHSEGIIGSYDSIIVRKDAAGQVLVAKTEKPTQHGGWLGLAAGAALAVAAPVAMPGVVAAGGAGLGAWIGHLARGISRRDAREIGETLQDGTAALIVVGVNKDADRVQKAAVNAARRITRRVDGDYEEAERDAAATAVGS